MRDNYATEAVILLALALILLTGLVFMDIKAEVEVRDAYVRGAKIGIAATSPDSYRTIEVRGSCEDVFRADECIQCHEF